MRTAPVPGHAGPPAGAVLDGDPHGHLLSGPPPRATETPR
ncbi:hypothetical protein RKD28_001399 [Streptomyces sp. SAI-229]